MDLSRFTEAGGTTPVNIEELLTEIRERTNAELERLRHERDTLRAALAKGGKSDG